MDIHTNCALADERYLFVNLPTPITLRLYRKDLLVLHVFETDIIVLHSVHCGDGGNTKYYRF
jgi:hypothetical protein